MFEVDQHQAFLRRLVPVVLSSSAGWSFIFRPPDTGNKSDALRRSGVAFVRWPLPALPAFAGGSFARLRFKAGIRSITGGGSVTRARFDGQPLHLGLDQLPQGLPVAVSVGRHDGSA